MNSSGEKFIKNKSKSKSPMGKGTKKKTMFQKRRQPETMQSSNFKTEDPFNKIIYQNPNVKNSLNLKTMNEKVSMQEYQRMMSVSIPSSS